MTGEGEDVESSPLCLRSTEDDRAAGKLKSETAMASLEGNTTRSCLLSSPAAPSKALLS